jgi:hypothetical protein
VALIGGLALVAALNLYMFSDVERLSEAEKIAVYRNIYLTALVVPVISVAGVVLAYFLKRHQEATLIAQGMNAAEVRKILEQRDEEPAPNWWILGGSLAFVAFTLGMGFSSIPFNQEIIFAGSFGIIAFLVGKLTRELEPEARATLIGTIIVIFVFRAVPLTGEGVTWWMIDVLGFDQRYLAVLSLIASVLTLFGMFLFRRFMAERSITYVVGFLTLVGAILSTPIVGLYYGLHEWTAAATAGVVDARFIVLMNTALESPLGQIAMIPMLAWIANSAPTNLKATYFAVMASFTNLALSASQLGAKYLNEIFIVTREVKDAAGAVKVPADYSQLGDLLITQLVLALLLPFAAILIVRWARLRSA